MASVEGRGASLSGVDAAHRAARRRATLNSGDNRARRYHLARAISIRKRPRRRNALPPKCLKAKYSRLSSSTFRNERGIANAMKRLAAARLRDARPSKCRRAVEIGGARSLVLMKLSC